jgi:predicted HTH domain antitoxin
MSDMIVLSPDLRSEVAAVKAAGIYRDEDAFLADAVRTFLAARPDLREAVACQRYVRGEFSLGRAAEWSGLTIEEMKDALHRWGVARTADDTPAEVLAMATKTLAAAERAQS